ncbi:hypothetical protein CIB48_g4750 [Xylaria polymorpha]|nr:hypothetical protein CIB48_g4750 [Xylaria polymorpha]
MDHHSDDTLAIPTKPGTESYVVDYGFLARAQLQRDPTASFIAPTVSGPTDRDSLKYSLKNSMVNAVKDDKQTFLPLGQLDAICNRNAVQDELLRAFKPNWVDITKYVNYVCGDPSDPRREEHTMNFFTNWNPVDKREFYQTQWQLLSPFFGKAPRDSAALYKLDEQTIMPWVSMGKEQAGAYVPLENIGGFSTVRKIVIHPDHHSFGTEFFAVKDLFDGDEDPFEIEFNNLKKVKTRKHLLPVHAAYVCGNQYSFIFPWAHGGSLEDLCKKEPQSLISDPERDFHVLVKWVAGQLSGLTGEFGLGFLHGVGHPESSGDLVVPGAKPFGIHGDIKPSNILYFKQDGSHDYLNPAKDLLKISDFGLTGFHSARTRSRLPATGPHSPTYRSPEWGRDGMNEGFLSRKYYDIWSLGCVFLEFLTWVIGGPRALERFNEDRRNDTRDTGTKFREDKYFVIEGKHRHIKPSVTQWVKKLQDQVGEGNYLHDCLGFIIERMLEISDNKRADCSAVNKFLEEHYKLCIQDEEYSKIDIRREPISRESSRSSTKTAASESSPVIVQNGEFLQSDPSERPSSYPPITVTGPHGEDVHQISPYIDHPDHSATLSPGSHSRQKISWSQEESPPGQTSPPEQLLPSPPSVPVEEADTPPEIATPFLNGSASPSQSLPQEKKSPQQTSFTQRIRNSKWFCFS